MIHDRGNGPISTKVGIVDSLDNLREDHLPTKERSNINTGGAMGQILAVLRVHINKKLLMASKFFPSNPISLATQMLVGSLL